MKYLIVLGDGMADEPIEEIGFKTPMEFARTPNFDRLAAMGEVGLVDTIPKGMSPGSDTANLSVMGYDPRKYYTGRSPLEAISIGATMEDADVCFRVNFVTLSEEEPYEEKVILDHSSDEITTAESEILIEVIKEHFEKDNLAFYRGVSYRHALIWKNGSTEVELTPPHNILGKVIGQFLPKGDYSQQIEEMMRKSYQLLDQHPINMERRKKGLRPANSIWLWGEGTRPAIPSFEELFGMKGTMISAVDLLKGIAIAAKMDSVDVDGATGNLHTNYQGKVEAVLKAIDQGSDFVYLHIEAPDECGHQGNLFDKITAIELIDEKVIAPLVEEMGKRNIDYKIGILPDHPTPISIRTHTSEPVPYLIYTSNKSINNPYKYNEKQAQASGKFIGTGYQFMPYFLDKE